MLGKESLALKKISLSEKIINLGLIKFFISLNLLDVMDCAIGQTIIPVIAQATRN